MINLLLVVLFFGCFAMLFQQGIWNNAITLINVITAGLVATSLFEPLANRLESIEPTYTYLWDFIAVWAAFCLAFIVMRAVTSLLSHFQLRLKQVVNTAGSAVLAVWISWVMVCFTTMTLHMAPLSRNFLGGSFQPRPDSKMLFGLAPDQRWLAFVQKVSRGSLATTPPEGVAGEKKANVFDPRGEFIYKYAQRRATFEKQLQARVYRGKPAG